MSGPGATPAPDSYQRRGRSGAVPRTPACLLSTPPLIAILLILAGCATLPQPSVVLGTAKPLPPVQVPVAVPCITDAQRPEVPPSSMPPRTAGVAELAAGAAADALKYRELARLQNEMLKACAKKETAP